MEKPNFSLFTFNKQMVHIALTSYHLTELEPQHDYFFMQVARLGHIIINKQIVCVQVLEIPRPVIYQSNNWEFMDTTTLSPDTMTLSLFCMKLKHGLINIRNKSHYLRKTHFVPLVDLIVKMETGRVIQVIHYPRRTGIQTRYLPETGSDKIIVATPVVRRCSFIFDFVIFHFLF